MADAPITYTKWATEDGKPTRYFYQLILDLWTKTGGSNDVDFVTLFQTINQTSPAGGNVDGQTVNQAETSTDYTISGDFDLEIVTVTGTAAVTVTMPVHYEGAEVIVTKGGTGRVTVEGNGTNIMGLASQELVMQNDSAHMYGKSAEWGLR